MKSLVFAGRFSDKDRDFFWYMEILRKTRAIIVKWCYNI